MRCLDKLRVPGLRFRSSVSGSNSTSDPERIWGLHELRTDFLWGGTYRELNRVFWEGPIRGYSTNLVQGSHNVGWVRFRVTEQLGGR